MAGDVTMDNDTRLAIDEYAKLSNFATPDVREVSHEAVWTLSSAKPGGFQQFLIAKFFDDDCNLLFCAVTTATDDS